MTSFVGYSSRNWNSMIKIHELNLASMPNKIDACFLGKWGHEIPACRSWCGFKAIDELRVFSTSTKTG